MSRQKVFALGLLFLMVVLVACGAETQVEPAVAPVVSETEVAEVEVVEEEVVEKAENAVQATAVPLVEPTAEPEMGDMVEETAEPMAEEAMAMGRSGAFGAGESGYVGAGTAVLSSGADGNYVVTLSEDFSISNGPDLYVVLSPAANPTSGTAVGDYLKLDDLQSTNGSQSYAVPPGTDVSLFQSIVIYCEAFSVVFSSAPLQ